MGTVEFTSLHYGARYPAKCTWESLSDESWRVSVEGQFAPESAGAADAFDALREIRSRLERKGWSLGLTGALVNVWPSGMARSTGGTRAYVIDEGRIMNREALEVVDVFSPAPADEVSSVEEQLAYARRYLGDKVR